MALDVSCIRTDQVGSLLRPQALIDAFLRFGQGKIDEETLEAMQDQAILDVVARQESAGLKVVTDGEFRRLNWQVSFSRVEGWDQWDKSWERFVQNPSLVGEEETPLTRGKDAVESSKIPATAKLSLLENFPLKEYSFLAKTARSPGKVMLIGPDRITQMCNILDSTPHYETAEAFLADVVAIEQKIIGDLVDSGCPYVQLDEPSYTGYVDRETLERIAARGEDPRANLTRAIDASNAVIQPHAGKAIFGLHICRGNRASMWHREGTYDGIAELIFSRLKFDRLLLEYDTERAGGFEPLRFVPKGVHVVLGLVTTKQGTLETVDELLQRIEDASRYVDPYQLAISPQCGFASGIAGNMLSEDEQWRKFEVINETARRAWD